MLMIGYALRENLLPPIRSKYADMVRSREIISMDISVLIPQPDFMGKPVVTLLSVCCFLSLNERVYIYHTIQECPNGL